MAFLTIAASKIVSYVLKISNNFIESYSCDRRRILFEIDNNNVNRIN